MTTDRITLGQMTHPVRGLLNGMAALVFAAGLVALISRTIDDPPRLISMVIFGASLVGLYVTSALYHAIPWPETWNERVQRVDHSMIFVLIAGTWTPVAFNVLSGAWRWTTLALVWVAAGAGILQKAVWPRVRASVAVALQTAMGWFVVVPFYQIAQRLSGAAVGLIIAGGLAYMLGLIVFATKRPRLFPRIFSYHEVFHVLVILGSICHFVMILVYVVPMART